MTAANGCQEWRLRKRWSRTVATAVVIGLGGAVTAPLGPTGAVHAQTSPRSAEEAATPLARKDVKPFDLSFMPGDVKKILAFRPEAIHRSLKGDDHETEAFAICATPLLMLERLLLRSELPTIEQVVQGFDSPPGDAAIDPVADMKPDCLMVRTIDPFDWKGRSWSLLTLFAGPLTERKLKGGTYYQSTARDNATNLLYPGECFLFPDNHTMVIGREKAVRQVIEQDRNAKPELVRGDAWRAVETWPLVVVMDRPADLGLDGVSDFLMTAFELDLMLVDFKDARQAMIGLDGLDPMTFHAFIDFPTAKAAGENDLKVVGFRLLMGVESTLTKVTATRGNVDPLVVKAADAPPSQAENLAYQAMTRMAKVQCDGRMLHLTKATRISFKEWMAALFAKGEAAGPFKKQPR